MRTAELAWRPDDIKVGAYTFYYGLSSASPCFRFSLRGLDKIGETGTAGNEIAETDPAFMKLHGDELKKDPGRWIDSAVWQCARVLEFLRGRRLMW